MNERSLLLVVVLTVVMCVTCDCNRKGQGMSSVTGSEKRKREQSDLDTATFGAGCFWGVEETFRNVEGVADTEVGYTGGSVTNPSYEQVCSGRTGHAESVRVRYDPDRVSYGDLLEVFWKSHNPTTRNRQGPDVGSQYRSAIFYHNEEQKQKAETSKKAQQEELGMTIVTEIVPAEKFYRAEEYHQRYHEKHRH